MLILYIQSNGKVMGCSHHYSVLHRIINPVFYVKDLGRYVSKLGSIYEKMFLSISLSRIFILFRITYMFIICPILVFINTQPPPPMKKNFALHHIIFGAHDVFWLLCWFLYVSILGTQRHFWGLFMSQPLFN